MIPREIAAKVAVVSPASPNSAGQCAPSSRRYCHELGGRPRKAAGPAALGLIHDAGAIGVPADGHVVT